MDVEYSEDVYDGSKWPGRWIHLQKVLERSSPFSHPDFEPSSEVLDFTIFVEM